VVVLHKIMVDVLYADRERESEGIYSRKSNDLIKSLKESGVEVDVVGFSKERDIFNSFIEDFLPNISNYRVLVSHLGTDFQRDIFNILYDNPNLFVA